MCTSDVKFEIQGTEDCESRGFEQTGFQRVNTEGEPGWTQTFVYEDPAPASTDAGASQSP